MKDFRQLLDQQLRKLEAEQELIDQAITEIRRRQGVLEEIAGWNLAEEEAEPAQAQESENHSGEPEWRCRSPKKLGEPEPSRGPGLNRVRPFIRGLGYGDCFPGRIGRFCVGGAGRHHYLADLLLSNFPPGTQA